MNDAVRKAGLFICGIAAAFLLLEGGLRVQHAFMGDRREDRAAGRAPGQVRTVMCIGDSYTYGVGAPREMSYPSQLQRLLGPGYRVVNLGMGGKNSFRVLEDLRSNAASLNPDVVVILCGANNLWDFGGYDAYRKTNGVWSRLRTVKLVKLLVMGVRNRTDQRRAAGGHAPEARPAAPGHAMKPKKEWRNFANFAPRNDAEYRALREGFEKGIRADPEDMTNYQGLGLLYKAMGKHEDAVRYFSLAIEKDPAVTRNYQEMARVYEEMGRYRDAVVRLDRALEVDPGDYLSYECLGHVYQLMSRYPESLRAYRRGLEIRPAQKEEDYGGILMVARLAPDKETRDEAFRTLKELCGGRGSDLPPLTLMGRISEEKEIPDARIEEWLRGDIGAMVRLCRERKITVILMGYPIYFEKINAVLGAAARAYALPFVDNRKLFDDLASRKEDIRGYFMPDGHCNAKGYRVMAEGVYAALLHNGVRDKHE